MELSNTIKFKKCHNLNMYHLDLDDKFTSMFYQDMCNFFAKSNLEIRASKPMVNQNKINMHLYHPSWKFLQHILRIRVISVEDNKYNVAECDILDKLYVKSKKHFKIHYNLEEFKCLLVDIKNIYLKTIEFEEE